MLNMVNLVSFRTSIYHILILMEIIHHCIRYQVAIGIVRVNCCCLVLENVLRFISPILLLFVWWFFANCYIVLGYLLFVGYQVSLNMVVAVMFIMDLIFILNLITNPSLLFKFLSYF